MDAAVTTLREQAKATGIAFALVRDTSHTGAIGYYAEQLAETGLAALIAVAGPPLMAYQGAAVASVSTSPLALAVPGEEGAAPIVLDMATSVAAMGRIMEARRAGKPIPPDWALAADGAPTTDAAKAVLPLPLGGPKGAGLSLMFELMTGVLAANPILTGAIASEETRKNALNGLQNAMLLAIDVAVFRPLADFRRDAGALGAALKALPKQPGTEEILLPGERGGRRAGERRAKGIPVPPPLWETLTKLAAERNVALPATKS
jgi:ureidoglycolate dehydrogenase (NAD+)